MNQDPLAAEFTIEETVDVLRVSEAFVAGLIEAGTLRLHDGASRMAAADVFAYRDLADAEAERTSAP